MKSQLHTPAVKALGIQCLTLLLIMLLTHSAGYFFGFKVNLFVVVLLQGLVAATGAQMLRLAPWWVWIQLLFPMALMLTYSLHLPPAIFLVLFIFFVVLYWSCFRTQVPFYPSRRFATQAVSSLLASDRPIRFIDIGSGLGGLVINLALNWPKSEFIGIELAPLPWLISRLRVLLGKTSAHFLRGDYQDIEFSQFNIVFAYLSPAAMDALWYKAKAEMLPGSLLLSYEFIIVDHAPDLTILDTNGGPALYGWHF